MKTFALSIALGAFVLGAFSVSSAQAEPARDAILATIEAQAKAENSAFAGFTAAAGEALFTAKHTGGKPETPSCTSCHGADLRGGNEGQPSCFSCHGQKW